MLVIPVIDADSQTLSANLGGQACRLNVYVKSTGTYCDVYVDGAIIIGGVACRDRGRVVLDAYLGFVGDLMFVDTLGTDDPTSPGLGTRFLLMYVDAADLVAAGLIV